MKTSAVRGLADLCERLSRRFQGWADNLPAEPFDRIIPAALQLVEKSPGFMAAEIGVSHADMRQYLDGDPDGLSTEELRDVGRFFGRRGVYDVRVLSWLGFRIIVWRPEATVREAMAALDADATASRIAQFQREAELRR
ncbi:hypothetical protein [Brevundimonas sp.]|uniref:hypothetical protein n=1 Tax=Brevundimonas sp. TaxID=1871086 RepID=UPI003D115C93